MSEWLDIEYRDFWDVPRVFLVEHRGETLLFDSPFDEELDDYPPHYRVYRMPPLSPERLADSWTELAELALGCMGQVPVAACASIRPAESRWTQACCKR